MSLLINTCSDMDEKENEISSMVAECKKNMDELHYMYETDDVNILSQYSRKIKRISDEIHNISQDILAPIQPTCKAVSTVKPAI